MKRLFLFLKLSALFWLIFEISRVYFILYHSHQLTNSLGNTIALTTLSGFRLDLSTIAYCLSPFLILILFEGLFRRQFNRHIYNTLVIIELFVIFAITISDPELYRQWGTKFNNQVLVYISHPKEMAVSSGAVQWFKTIPFSIVLALLLILIGKGMSKLFQQERQYSIQYSIADVVLLLSSFVMLRGGVGVATISQSSAIYSDKQIENAASINSLWNALYYIFNDTESLYGEQYNIVDEVTLKREFANNILPDTASFVVTKHDKFNVMIVMLESFTAYGSQYFTGYSDCMPELDEYAKSNLSFMSCYASGDRTEKGLVSVLSGYPAQPASSIIVFPDKVAHLNSLGKVFKDLSYFNSFYYGGDAEFASMKSYLIQQGITNIVDKKAYSSKELNSKWGAHDANVYDKVLAEHANIKGRFFTTILSLSSHEPYDVPLESNDLKRDEQYAFKNSIRYADKSLGAFLEACSKAPWYNETLIVLVADHGHEIGLAKVPFFGKQKYHIPLILGGGALKNALKGKQITTVVSQTIIPSIIVQSLNKVNKDFNWQTGIHNVRPFAQYHYNSGFGRIESDKEAVYDNLCQSFVYSGDVKDSAQLKRSGLIFQQYLIQDFKAK